ncbi:transposase [Sulfoacidibacillus ferrooxidans]
MQEDGRVRFRAAMIATGVNEEGYRKILYIMFGDNESETTSSNFFLLT